MASRNTNLDFYNDPLPWEPLYDCYPRNDVVMRYFISHIKLNYDRNAVKCYLALFVKDIWEKENGFPKSYLRIQEQFDGLYRTYFRYRREGRGSKNSHKKKAIGVPPKKPTQRSSRHGESQLISTLNVGTTVTDTEEADFAVAEPEEKPSVHDTSPPTKKLRSLGYLAVENPHKDV